jgi:hypothetical protein
MMVKIMEAWGCLVRHLDLIYEKAIPLGKSSFRKSYILSYTDF